MPKNPLFFIVLIIILLYATFIYLMRPEDNGEYVVGKSLESDRAVNQAKHFYGLRKASGESFANGPCLSDALMPNWVADIVHNPREAIDDQTAYQCPSFLEGKAQHFVELDMEGNVVRVK